MHLRRLSVRFIKPVTGKACRPREQQRIKMWAIKVYPF
jgi:hypothetical protein